MRAVFPRLFAILLFLLTAHAALADGIVPALSGEVTLTSDYIFRGVSQTREGPALQAGAEARWDIGLHVGTWASNVDFDSAATAEVDLVAGFRLTLGPALRLEAGTQLYAYVNEEELSYLEAYLELDVGEVLKTAARYTAPWLYDTGEALYLEAAAVFPPLHDGPEWEMHLGYSSVEEGPDVLDFMLRIGWRIRRYRLDLAFWTTEGESGPASELAGERLVLSLSRNWP